MVAVLGASLFQCGNLATDGCNPRAGLILLSDGFLYGTTNLGGADNSGTVFKIATDGTGFQVIRSFNCNVAGGCNPQAGLIQLGDGFLYGTTTNQLNSGTLFQDRDGRHGLSGAEIVCLWREHYRRLFAPGKRDSVKRWQSIRDRLQWRG